MRRDFVLIGDPVAHSLSPRIHTAVFDHWGVDAGYDVLRVDAGDLPAELSRAARRGGGNVTLPHKRMAARCLDQATADVGSTGACNCFWGLEGGGVAGDNTDVGGFTAALPDVLDDASGAGVLLLGAGGAARAVVQALLGLGVAEIRVWNRTPDRARRLAARFGGAVQVVDDPASGPADLLVNATRLGLESSDPLPCDLSEIDVGAVFDLVYARGGTALVYAARELGLPATDGLPMLVHQAALSLRRWFPDRDPPLDVMFRAVRGSAG
jgi:shikimate dehydrogenase